MTKEVVMKNRKRNDEFQTRKQSSTKLMTNDEERIAYNHFDIRNFLFMIRYSTGSQPLTSIQSKSREFAGWGEKVENRIVP
jgi:hypothetical protein